MIIWLSKSGTFFITVGQSGVDLQSGAKILKLCNRLKVENPGHFDPQPFMPCLVE